MEAIRRCLVAFKGAGDLGTGAAHRLHRVGFPVVILEQAAPTVIRRRVAFAQAVFDGVATVEGVTARRVGCLDQVESVLAGGEIPVLVDPKGEAVDALRPTVLVDATLCKKEPSTRLDEAPFVVGLGPGFVVGVHAHAVVETQRGHRLGRVYWEGSAQPDTGIPGEVAGRSARRVLRAPAAGAFRGRRAIGDRVAEGEVVAQVGEALIRAPFDGVLRGLLADGLEVRAGMKVGDVDPRGVVEHCFTISDKALAVGGGVLEAILIYLKGRRGRPQPPAQPGTGVT